MAALLGACSSAKQESGQKPMSDSMRSRVMSVDMSRRSSYESALVTENSGMGGFLQKKGYKAKEYGANTRYRAPQTLKQESYARSDAKSRLETQNFQRSGQQSREAGESFQTDPAREAAVSARQQDQTFGAAEDTFKTGSVRDAAKSQAENKRPVIVQPDGGMVEEKPYTEEEIRRMVNRR